MNNTQKMMILGAACMASFSNVVLGQPPPAAVLEIDVVNLVTYESDAADYTKFATNPSQVSGIAAKNFSYFIGVGDIVAVNGKPAKGTVIGWHATLNATPNAVPGQMIADITRNSVRMVCWEIMQSDGTPIGSIMGEGLGGGPSPPGAPLTMTQANHAVTGGTGAFLGVRGQFGSDGSKAIAFPTVSVTEDPANRRLRPGGATRFVLELIPMSYPEVLNTASGPAIVHAIDFSPVTASKPAAAGEILTMIVGGLGPTKAKLNPGQPFPSDPLALVTSPVQVSINGMTAEVLYAGGYPNTTNLYQVNFQVPSGVARGTARVQVSAAWISGPEVGIAIQ